MNSTALLVYWSFFRVSDQINSNNFSTGIPWIARKMMTSSSPTIEISKKDEKWTVKTSTLVTSSSNTFQLGEEYDETMMGGRSIKVKKIFSVDASFLSNHMYDRIQLLLKITR